MSDPEHYPRISVGVSSPECEQLVIEWNQRTYQDPRLAAIVLKNMIDTPEELSLTDEQAIYYHFLTGSLLEATGNGKQLDFPDIDDDAVFETPRHQELFQTLQKARRSGDKDAEQQSLRRLSLDLLSHQVEAVEA